MDRDNMNFDLDALLEEAKSYSSGTPVPASADVSSAAAQNWSLDDIDALIAGLDTPAPEKPVSPAPEQEEKEVTQEYEAKQIKEVPGENVPVESYFDKNAKPEPVAIELPEEEWVTTDDGKVLKTLGRRNLHLEKSLYNMNAQPYYVLIDAEGNTLTDKNYQYNRDTRKFVAWLNEGLTTYTENRNKQ